MTTDPGDLVLDPTCGSGRTAMPPSSGPADITISQDGDELRVILRGVDVYDPNTGESDETDQVALRMIDTAYNGESFLVRHCYFTGGQDPNARLERASRPTSTSTPGQASTPPSPARSLARSRGGSRSRSSTTTATR